MATEDKYLNELRGSGSRFISGQSASMTMAAGATTKGQIVLPPGSHIRKIMSNTPTAFTGSPTNINLSVGTTDGGVDIVAAVDRKAQGNANETLVSALDLVGGFANQTTLFVQIAAVGGTNPVGTTVVWVDYAAPVH